MITLHLPCDSLARAVGADQVAEALESEAARRQLPLQIRRTSSRGLYWLEPLLEVDSPQGRLGFGPVGAEDVPDSGLRGRGGAAFPAGIKWRTVRQAPAAQKYIVCNADEGDSGTFADRMLMEGDPFLLIEGMIIAGLAVGASKGYIYVRSEYPDAIAALNEAVILAREAGYLDVNGSGVAFELEVRVGAGAYICGEETALLESIEGKRGIVRAKPPLPALEGLFGQPTLVHNVLTLASVPIILAKGAAFYRDFGMGRSLGTLPFQLAGNVRHGGLVERAFGLTLRELVEGYGGGGLRRRHRQRPTVESRADRWAAGRLGAAVAVRYAAGLRGLCCHGSDDRPRRRGGSRRYPEHGQHGALRPAVLRRRILRQVHPVPDWFDPRHGSGRPVDRQQRFGCP